MVGGNSHYSGMNPVPNIQKFVESLDRDKAERDRRIEEAQRDDESRPHQETKAGKAGTQKSVTDPTTGKTVIIEDVDKRTMDSVKNPMLTVPNANLGKPTTVKLEPTMSGAEYKEKQDITAPPDPIAPGSTSDVPIHGERTNILFHPTPSISFEPAFASMEQRAAALCVGVLVAIIFLGKVFGGSLFGLIPTAACVSSGIWLWTKGTVQAGREIEWESEKKRGEVATANLIPESVEWMNTLTGVIWGLINPDMFASVADTLEDVMQASLPGIVENVRVAEINQGSNPIRILSVRSLPDDHVKELKDSVHIANAENKDPQELAADEEGGDYYNVEVAFAYHAAPSGADVQSKARNMHMQMVFYLGVKGLFGVPLPIWVELQGLVGTVRLRLQMTPEPPFLKALTFSLMGIPHVQAGCIPMVQRGINILNLPLISNFVNYAIGAAASMYVAPKSMTLDMGKILAGDDVQKEVDALGVMWIRLHRAVGLSKQDRRGSKGGGSDPYITISFSKYGKPMYCTRVITDELNPVWEETAAVLVTPDLIKADEQLSVELWDSDRSSADDIVGKVQLSMQKMIQHPGKMYPQVSTLQGLKAESVMPGELRWEVGFFGKPNFRPALRSHGKDTNLPDSLKDKTEFQDDKGSLDNAEEDAVAHTPPDPLWPSGICSVIVHQIVNLELDNIKGSEGKRKGREFEPAKPAGEGREEEGGRLPNSYCTFLFNDQLVYRTRAKAVSSKPIFNAGTERFIRDWKSAIITITVRDQRQREHDPILGVVPLKLTEVLTSSSQVTRWYPLDGGVGFGRIRISLLFRSVETRLPPQMLGWDVGTFEFTSARLLALSYASSVKLKLRTGGSTASIPRAQSRKLTEGDGIYWDMSPSSMSKPLRLPVKYRYRAPIVFEFHTAGKRQADAFATIWLQHLVDNEEVAINIPIWRTKNGERLTQNYVTEENLATLSGYDDVVEVGRLHFRCRFKAGLDEDHAQFVSDNDSRETQESWEACRAEGVRGVVVSNELPEQTKELHDKSLLDGRDVLQQADARERQKWLAKDGMDWSGAFGEDPAEYVEQRRHSSPRVTVNAEGDDDDDDDDDDEDEDDDDDDSDDEGSSDSDLGVMDGSNTTAEKMNGHEREGSINTTTPGTTATGEVTHGKGPIGQFKEYKESQRDNHRRHRGLMQWKPMRNVAFAKDEMKFGVRKVRDKVGLKGREPDVETEL